MARPVRPNGRALKRSTHSADFPTSLSPSDCGNRAPSSSTCSERSFAVPTRRSQRIPRLEVKKMDSTNYAICEVEFEEGAQYAVVCSNWLIRPKNDETTQTYCLWPRKKELSAVLAKYHCVPDEDFWIRYKCRILIEYCRCIINLRFCVDY